MKRIFLPPPLPTPPLPTTTTISLPEFLTGRLPIRNGIFTSFGYPLDMVFRVFMPISEGGLPADEITIPDMLKAANYTSTLVRMRIAVSWSHSQTILSWSALE